ncbi:putative WD domain-containing protein [Rosellinia necatrix]|uniref:Putative WD domain-containing protein n=1 Tax=Rosellinia necatrix TaxID=77044 RepID=A0A1S7ULH6_ROSNE|nr:putative WD domain-containing protein [Rosellinia necatrix]
MAFPDKPVSHLLGSGGPVHALAYSASPGTYVLAGSSDRSVRLYNPQPATTNQQHSSHLSKKGASNSAAGGRGGEAAAVPEGRLIQTYSAHGYPVLSLSVSSDNARFASAGGDRAVFLWDVATAQTLRRFGGGATHGHTARVNAVCFAGEGDSLVASGGLDASVRLWDARSGAQRPVQVLADAKDAVTAVAARGPEVVAASVDGRVRSYDVRAGRCVADVVGPSVTSLCLTADGKAVLVGALDSKLRLMDRETGGCLKTYAAPGWRNQDFRVQSILGGKEQYVLAGDEMTGAPGQAAEGRVWAWDVVTGELKATIRVPWGPAGLEPKKIIGKDGKEKERTNVMTCLAWRDGGFGDQFCVSGTSGIVTVYGYN